MRKDEALAIATEEGDEIEQMCHYHQVKKSIDKTFDYIKKLEKEKDYWKRSFYKQVEASRK